MSGDEHETEYDRTLDAIQRGAPLPKRRAKLTATHAAAFGVVLGLLWQTVWAMFPDWRLPINGVAIYLVYRLIRAAHEADG